jgi:DNA-binding MarR family transcriptional regulator
VNRPRPATPTAPGAPLPAAGLDGFLHTPARLNICALLAPAEWVLFSFLRDSIGTSDSALSKQLTTLEQAGFVEIRKDHNVRRQTSVRLTDNGRARFDAYLASLEDLVARARGAADSARQRPAGADRLVDDSGHPSPTVDRSFEGGQPTRDGVFSSPN